MQMKVLCVIMILFASASSINSNCNGFLNFTYLDVLTSPVASYGLSHLPLTVSGVCGGNCTYSERFSCVTDDQNYAFTECNFLTERNGCLGRVSVSNDCNTLDCCKNLNEMVLPQVEFTSLLQSFNYNMKFYNSLLESINCNEFSSNTKDTCIQYADFGGAPSDRITCKAIAYYLKSDHMAFELF